MCHVKRLNYTELLLTLLTLAHCARPCVKRLNFVLSQDPDETRKFEDEAALLGRLRHPNIILFQGTNRHL